MFRRLFRSALFAAAIVGSISIPSAASAQTYAFASCSTPGVCGGVQAFFTGTLLTVRLSNYDDLVGSALFSAQIVFAAALGAPTPGADLSVATTATTGGNTSSVGNTAANGWFFSGVGGSNVLDLASFFNVYIEGPEPSPFHALPGDPDSGTWITTDGYVQFTGDLASIAGASGAQITGFGFCTDVDCASGDAIATPEPATLTLLATGLVGLAASRRRRKKTTV